jgi:hypothetical protein
VSEIPLWRARIFRTGRTLVLLNGAFFFVMIPLHGFSLFGNSDKVLGNIVGVGFIVGIASLAAGLFGERGSRWGVTTVACVETVLWWFMAVGF